MDFCNRFRQVGLDPEREFKILTGHTVLSHAYQ